MQEQKETLKQINRTMKVFRHSEGEVRPHFILTGPSGSGKSFSILKLAEKNNLNYLEINAAQLTKEGLAGNSLSKALAPLAQMGDRPCVCFVDEFDKLFISGNSNSDLAHESTNGVQNEMLKVLESETTAVFGDYGKYYNINIDKVLFVFAGAFNGEEDIDIDRLRQLGLKTELLGRVGLVFNLQKLALGSLETLLQSSPLLATYLELFSDVKREDALQEILEAVRENYENNTVGIRMINTLIHQYFIGGGTLPKSVAKSCTFQTKLSINDD